MIRDFRRIKRRKNDIKNPDDSDSDYVDPDSKSMCKDISSVITEKSNMKSSNGSGNDNDNDKILLDDDFSLELNTKSCSVLDDVVDFDDSTMTVAHIIKTSRKVIANTTYKSLNKTNSIGKEMRNMNDKLKINQIPSRTSNLEEVLKVFNLPNYWICHIPSFRIRETSINIKESAQGRSFARLSALAMKMIESSLRLLCPGPGFDNFQSYILNEMCNKQLKQKGTLRLESNNNVNKATDNNCKTNPYKRTTSEKLDNVVTTVCTWSNQSCKGSIERRVIRAVLYESFLKHEIREMKDGKHKLKQGNGQPVDQARSDADLLCVGHKLSKTLITRKKGRTILLKNVLISFCLMLMLLPYHGESR